MSIYIENKLVVTRTTEYAVQYQSGESEEPIVVQQDNVHTAITYARKLGGHVVQHMVFTSEWEPYFDTTT